MANLAKDKFGIELADNHLPMGELDQGIDILKIMRNIHMFVKRFNYNQNQQVRGRYPQQHAVLAPSTDLCMIMTWCCSCSSRSVPTVVPSISTW